MMTFVPECPDCDKPLNERCIDFNQPRVKPNYFAAHSTYRVWCPCGYARLVHDGTVIEETRDIDGIDDVTFHRWWSPGVIRTRRKRSFWDRFTEALATGGVSLVLRPKEASMREPGREGQRG